ncbi:MAG: enoyl-CoA hydratase/isomerase family protein [Deltaproteobacteria bacterium]|nr:MAG: enoyl-CoA hydratase/isomerase family protein [Deltaproteobacteria bacterium]
MSYGTIFQFGKQGDFGIISFDVAKEAMNTWTPEAIDEFSALIEDLEKAKEIKGAVFISGKRGNFHAGANLNMLDQMNDEVETVRVLDVFHGMFKRLEALPYPTLAAIEGHCLGGGLEFALACTGRIAKETKTTVIGLPECTLGIFPGGGGMQRLPRLIGYKALDLILKGTVLQASQALELGIIDRLVSADQDLLTEATDFLAGIMAGKVTLKRADQDFSQIDEVARTAREDVLKATRGRELPGLMLALASIRDGVKVSLEEGLEIEKTNFVKAVLSNEAKGSIHTFFLKTMSDKPKSLMSKGFEPKALNKIAILGFGTMGRGIAIDILRNTQVPVIVKDLPDALEPGTGLVRKILDGMAEKKKLKYPVDDLMNRLGVTAEYSDEFRDADLVIEAVFEDLKVKAQVYRELCEVIRDDCILASNTSSLPLNAMSKYVAHPERFGGAHFFSPVWLMQLVEIIRADSTNQDTVDNLLHFAASIRKRPIVCRDNPGFVVNAVLFPYFMSALEFLEKGNPIEQIDKAFVQFGMPVGPIRLIDEVGIDICYHVIVGKGLEQETLKQIVDSGRLGLKKSGKGFFLKDGGVDPEVLPLISLKKKQEMTAEEMHREVLTEMVTVGKDLLDREIVGDPRMIDIGMIWGTGFPADKGGPMKWADLIGLSQQMFGKPFYGAR